MSDQSSAKLTGFRADGILGGISYQLSIRQTTTIIVGPNGTGKSTFLSLFYLFLSRQWTRISEYDFERLTLYYEGGEISITRSDIMSLEVLPRSTSRIRQYVTRLAESNELERMLKSTLSADDRKIISETLQIPTSEVQLLKRFMTREIGLSTNALSVDNKIKNLGLGRILYMPTYRRIEKDIHSIFPDIEERFRTRIQESQITAREDVNFKEIVSFGMEDIEKLISSFIAGVKEYQRISSETASQEYIRDMVRGRISTYSLTGLRELSEEDLTDFISRLDVKLFTSRDRDSLSKQISEMRKRNRGQPNKDMRYLAFYVEKLLAAHRNVKSQEQPLLDFGRYISSYMGTNKVVKYTQLDFTVNDEHTGDPIPLNKMSSGEKQILSIFAYLLLKREKGYILFIDEPELSLSVPWQKTFLPNLLETGSCQYMFSVTHSPFVFDNSLRRSVIDVSRLRVN